MRELGIYQQLDIDGTSAESWGERRNPPQRNCEPSCGTAGTDWPPSEACGGARPTFGGTGEVCAANETWFHWDQTRAIAAPVDSKLDALSS